ncbi:MAG: hypothetical protein N4J56_004469 [Chroococcidiopsis sp. SAG 2025]|nr:hypothetical protein [Chroococcidiopsis sp. SAG 2025]MDV2994815.1 hypothetical protein [Chroococcidiopsis sp. SAG 2025]
MLYTGANLEYHLCAGLLYQTFFQKFRSVHLQDHRSIEVLIGARIDAIADDVRYSWAVSFYRQMRENFWIPEKIDVTQDVTDYINLTPG